MNRSRPRRRSKSRCQACLSSALFCGQEAMIPGAIVVDSDNLGAGTDPQRIRQAHSIGVVHVREDTSVAAQEEPMGPAIRIEVAAHDVSARAYGK